MSSRPRVPSSTLNVAAPKVLGDATDVVVAGFTGGSLDEQALAGRLLAVSAMYVGASLFSWIQGALTATAVQRVSYGLRGSVEKKLHLLPSSHFEEQRRGEVLSRATNDVDNISQALNQLLNQLIMSVLMLSAALAMMLWLSPLLALIAVALCAGLHGHHGAGGPAFPGALHAAVDAARAPCTRSSRNSSPGMRWSRPSAGRRRRRRASGTATTS